MKRKLIFLILLLAGSTLAISPSNMVYVEGGTFTMGDSFGENPAAQPAQPAHPVTLDSFQIAETEITRGEMARVMNWAYKAGKIEIKHGYIYIKRRMAGSEELLPWRKSRMKWDGGKFNPRDKNLPCRGVSWFGAAAYCNFRSEMEGLTPCYQQKRLNRWECDFSANGYRLPTEAEWEFAARGGLHSRNTKYSGSNDLKEVGWFARDNGEVTKTARRLVGHDIDGDGIDDEDGWQTYTLIVEPASEQVVGLKFPNELGLYDMSGNVSEWCNDRFGEYSGEAQTNPRGSRKSPFRPEKKRVVRGGHYLSREDSCRVDCRASKYPDECIDGFRVVRSVSAQGNTDKE